MSFSVCTTAELLLARGESARGPPPPKLPKERREARRGGSAPRGSCEDLQGPTTYRSEMIAWDP